MYHQSTPHLYNCPPSPPYFSCLKDLVSCTVFYVLSAHDVLSGHPLLRRKVTWKYLSTSTTGLLPVLKMMTAGK